MGKEDLMLVMVLLVLFIMVAYGMTLQMMVALGG